MIFMKYKYYAEKRFFNRLLTIFRLKIKNIKSPHPFLEQMQFYINQIHATVNQDIFFLAKRHESQMERDLVSVLPFPSNKLTDIILSKLLKFGEANNLYISATNFIPSNILTAEEIEFAEGLSDENERQVIYKTQKIEARSNENVASADAIIVDIDYYKFFQLNLLTPEVVIEKINEEVFLELNIKPHFAVFSGRGLQIIFLLENVPLYKNAENQAMYLDVLNAIVKILLPYGSDTACMDLAHLFRLPYTRNLASWKYAYIIDYENIKHTTFERYSLDFLYNKLCSTKNISEKTMRNSTQLSPVSLETLDTKPSKEKHITIPRPVKSASVSKKNHVISDGGLKNILLARSLNFKMKCEDLKIWLIAHYDKMDHRRNTFFDIYASCLVYWIFNRNQQWVHIQYINTLLKTPLPKNELRKFLNNSQKTKYNYSKKSIMQKLAFTEIDYAGKSVLYQDTPETLAKKNEQKKAQKRDYAKKKIRNENGLTQREQQMEDNLNCIKDLLKENKSVSQIIAITGLKKTAVYSYIKKIKSEV